MRVDDEFSPAPAWFSGIMAECREAMATAEWRGVPPPPMRWPRETPRRQRKPSIPALVKRAEKAGKKVTSVTTPDGVTIHFDKAEDTEASNPWLDDLRVTKQ